MIFSQGIEGCGAAADTQTKVKSTAQTVGHNAYHSSAVTLASVHVEWREIPDGIVATDDLRTMRVTANVDQCIAAVVIA